MNSISKCCCRCFSFKPPKFLKAMDPLKVMEITAKVTIVTLAIFLVMAAIALPVKALVVAKISYAGVAALTLVVCLPTIKLLHTLWNTYSTIATMEQES